MSENNEQKKELTEEELKRITGAGKLNDVLIVYECQKCGRLWYFLASNNMPAPMCCGETAKYYMSKIV